jgi:hypothetical protein
MDERLTLFKHRLQCEVLTHPVIEANPYTAWFKTGGFNTAQARAFLVQLSVFSNQFLLAQLQKVINAETLEEMRASKEILANEIGVGFRSTRETDDAELGDIEGSIEGGTFHFRAAHFELLVRMARQFGLRFEDLGKRRSGTVATLFFCDELARLYAHENYTIATAASWAVENWAAGGFWDELVQGWQRYGERCRMSALNFSFFTWHARLEANHARHTWQELEAFWSEQPVDADQFIGHACEMLDAVLVFWCGLDAQRQALDRGVQHAEIR